MKTLMYPIAPDDDFPEMFCAIRQGSGEHWFYVPEGESASWMLLRAVSENAKLLELVRDLYLCSDETCTDCEHHDYSGEGFWCKRGVGWKKARMRELGIEVDG